MFPSVTPSTQTNSGLFGVNNGFTSAPTSLFGVPQGGSGSGSGSGTSSFTFGQPAPLTSTTFGTPSFTGLGLTSSTAKPFGTPSFTGFSQTSSSVSSTQKPFGTPSFSPFNTSPAFSLTPTPFATPSFNPFNSTGTSAAFSSTQTPFGPPSTTGTPPAYAPTPFVETFGGNQTTGLKLISISGMPAYNTKSHEELRWENYMTGKTTAPFNPSGINSSAVKSSSSLFPANNISTTSWPSTIASPTWSYSGPISSTSITSQPLNVSPFTNTPLTTTPSNSYNPFAINKSTSSSFPPGSSLPVTTSWPTTTTSPSWISPGTFPSSLISQPLHVSPSTNTTLTTDNPFNPFAPKTNLTSPASTFPSTPLSHNPFQIPSTSQPLHVSPSTNSTLTTDPSNSFNPFAPKTNLTSPPNSFNPFASPASTFPSTPLSHNPFQIPSTSLPTQSSSSTFPSPAYPLKTAWPTSVDGPFPMVPATTNNQQSLSQITSTPAAASPFGILPPIPQLSFPRSTPIQYGISSMPVKDKLAPIRYPVLTTRHFSRGGKLPIRKYDPKLSGPKIPYYSKEIPDTSFVPRENPRALIITREKLPPRENMHEEKFSSSMYEKERDGVSADTGSEDPTKDQELFATIVDVPSKLQQPDYYTEPQISELEAKERAEPGYCRRVKDFVVGRHGYGSIKFFGETDVRKLDLETLIQFNNREVIVYMDESKKPPVGEGLNIPAEITLLNIKCINKKTGMQCVDGSMIDRYTTMLKKKAASQGAEFLSYDPVEGEWKFKVKHF